ncbi:MAG: selenocysteine-specific translation elongation factor [Mobilicoccus sp.]|nr:selenocysteine-specific translation elongation factor [Mobilicoccus sp.]
MTVIATAGHVDHGKSTLVRALTGRDPDRWEEERRRGLTIGLGYAWLQVAERTIAIVDVPGHRRFIGTMLAGLGPVPAVMLIVAADESWMPQSAEHLSAAAALGVEDLVLVVTRADLADPAPAMERAQAEIAAVGITPRATVVVSGRTGAGLDTLRDALADLARSMPRPDPASRARLWIDRAFSVAGAGTVVTGTLGAGSLRREGALDLLTEVGRRRVTVRGLHALDEPREHVVGPARVAVNVRGVAADDVHRGDALLHADAWTLTDQVDVRLTRHEAVGATQPTGVPAHLMLHVGTASMEVGVRPFGPDADTARLRLPRALPLVSGDRALLRDPGTGEIVGAVVLDPDPPALRRRGAGAKRGEQLRGRSARVDLAVEVAARGHLSVKDALRLGVDAADLEGETAGVIRVADVLVAPERWALWQERLGEVVREYARTHPMSPWMPTEAARAAAELPDGALVAPLAASVSLVCERGRVHEPGVQASLGPAEQGLARIEERLAETPFAAPERPDLDAAGLGKREIAAAISAGRLIRLDDDVLLRPQAPAQAMRILAALPQPFTTSEARRALDTTRRVAIPLLEHLDARGWTRRIDAGHREVVR